MADAFGLEGGLSAPNWEAAVDELLTTLAERPDFSEGYRALGLAFLMLDQLDKALVAVAESIRLNAGEPQGYVLLATIWERLGLYPWAARAWQTVLTLAPEREDAQMQRLRLRRLPGDFELGQEQEAQFERILSLAHPRLSACLIVRDEAKNLPRCLAALKPWVDEIVVVDTGSEDETVDIARSFGARVSHFVWCDDFSAARNASLEAASGDWLLVIDADEVMVLGEGELTLLRSALRLGAYGCFWVDVVDMDDAGQPAARSRAMRIFRNVPGLAYTGCVHNDIVPAVNRLKLRAEYLPLALAHYGYSQEQMRAKNKFERTLRLARKGVARTPEDPVSWFHVLRAAKSAGGAAEAFEAFVRLRALVAQGAELHPYYDQMAWEYGLEIATDQFPERLDALLLEALRAHPRSPAISLIQARHARESKEFTLAASAYQSALAGEFEDHLLPDARERLRFAALSELAGVYAELEAWEEARACLRVAAGLAAASPTERVELEALGRQLDALVGAGGN